MEFDSLRALVAKLRAHRRLNYFFFSALQVFSKNFSRPDPE